MLLQKRFINVAVVAALACASIGALSSGAAARTAEPPPPETGCDLLESKGSKGKTVCVKTDVEAWYHTETTSVGIPSVTGLPEFNPYEADTLHVGIKQGNEDSRIYLTLDLTGIPITAGVTGGTLVLPVDEEGSEIPDRFFLQSCTVEEPPEESRQGAFDEPPKTSCSVGERARFVEKPFPALTVDLSPVATALTLGEGLALVPGEKAVQEQETWHFSVFARKNSTEEAVDIGALLTYDEIEPLVDIESPVDEAPLDTGGGGGGGTGVGAPPAISTGDFGGAAPPIDTGGVLDVAQPVEAGSPPQQPLGAVAIPRYKGVWFLPLALLLFVGMLGVALTKDLKAARISPPASGRR